MNRSLFKTFACLSLLTISHTAQSEESEGEFLEPTIDLGCVVSDVEASVKFYTEAIGFQNVGGFEVNGPYAKDVGLTDGSALKITILTLGEGEEATKLKLMQVEGSNQKAPNDHIHTTLGYSYITIFVKSTDAALERLKNAGVETIANSPLPLPDNLDPAMSITLVRDPDGNFVELVGPNATH